MPSKKSKKQLKKELEERIDDYMTELREMQLRKNRKTQTAEERLEQLGRIADSLLYTIESKVLMGEMTGTAALTTALQRVEEVREKTLKTDRDNMAHDMSVHTMCYEYDLPDDDNDEEV